MKKNLQILTFANVAFLFMGMLLSCNETKKETTSNKKEVVTEIKDNSKEEQKNAANLNDFKFVETAKMKNVPLEENTNFDNFIGDIQLNAAEMKLLSLDKIINDAQVTKVYLNYRINLSNSYKTLVVSYEKGDAEMITILVNYDDNYNVIDSEKVAYDEIAESMFNIESEIKKDGIISIETDYSNEEPEEKEIKYTISPVGKISKINQ